MPKHLTEAQVEDFRRDEFIFPMNAISAEEVGGAGERHRRI